MLPTVPRTPLLFDAYPSLARALPFVPLCDVPTPVEPCSAIAGYLGRREGVAMKRDDRISSLYGGTFSLGRSDSGGLLVELDLPAVERAST